MANKKHRGKLVRAERQAALSALAGEGSRCLDCNGTGKSSTWGWDCPKCDGTGHAEVDLSRMLREAKGALEVGAYAQLSSVSADALAVDFKNLETIREYLAVIEQRLRARRAGR